MSPRLPLARHQDPQDDVDEKAGKRGGQHRDEHIQHADKRGAPSQPSGQAAAYAGDHSRTVGEHQTHAGLFRVRAVQFRRRTANRTASASTEVKLKEIEEILHGQRARRIHVGKRRSAEVGFEIVENILHARGPGAVEISNDDGERRRGG